MLFFKGFLIGAAMLIPGSSGGSAAMIMGLYDRIIISTASLFSDFKKNFIFLFKICAGAFAALIIFTKFLFPYISGSGTRLLHFAAVAITLISIPVFLYRSGVCIKSKRNAAVFLCVAAVYLLFSFITGKFAFSEGFFYDSPFGVFAAGVILSAALVLPGISFSFMLLYMGLYEKALNALNGADVFFLIPMALGITVGTVVCVIAFKDLLKTHKEEFASGIAAFLLMSLIV